MSQQHYERIWQTLDHVPAGHVVSYGQLADLAGLPGRARLAGKSLGMVPENRTVPWHRVIRSNGQIAFPAGSDQAKIQQTLLREEGVIVINNRVSMSQFQWQPSLQDLLYKLSF